MQQGTSEWLEFRRSKLGASDAPIVLGISPYKTPHELWLEKTGRKEPPAMNYAMKRGHELEDSLRIAYEELTGNIMMPKVITHDEFDWMMASLDGVSMDGSIILEIKTCNAKIFEAAKSGKPIDHHYAQIQHQLACAPDAEFVHYFIEHKGEHHLLKVVRDEEYIQKLTCDLIMFHQCMIEDIAPELTEDDYVVIEHDPEFAEAAQLWLSAKESLDEAKKAYDTAKSSLMECTDDGNCMGYGVVLNRCQRKPTDCKQAALDAKVDISQYTSESIGYWTIREVR